MPKTERLTQAEIKKLRPKPGRQYVVWDADPPGFGVRVSPAGAKAYVFKYRLKSGRVRWKTLGRVGGKLSLEQARDRAYRDRGLVADGKDPLAEIDAARGSLTLADVAKRFLAEYVAERRKAATLRLYRLVIERYIRPQLGTVPIAEVSTDDAVRLHHKLRETPYLANRALAVLSKLLSWAMQARYRPAGPNPCAGIEKFNEKKRRRYLSAEEYARVGRVMRDARKAGTIATAPLTAIELLLLTGCRPQEIATLKWAYVDVKAGVLNLPDSKTGEKAVYLSPQAVRLLKAWPRWADSPFVFPGTGRGGKKGAHIHATTLSHVWETIREAAGLEDVRLYDACRHSYASVGLSQHGLSLAQIGEQLGHSQPATTARYAHLHDEIAKRNAAVIGGSIAAALKRRAK